MSNMILSPIQPNRGENEYVTSEEFATLSRKVDEGFEKVFEHIDIVESHLDKRIGGLESRFDALETNMNSRFEKVDKRLGRLEEKFDDVSSQVRLLVRLATTSEQ